jgi:hypothetical protein
VASWASRQQEGGRNEKGLQGYFLDIAHDNSTVFFFLEVLLQNNRREASIGGQ